MLVHLQKYGFILLLVFACCLFVQQQSISNPSKSFWNLAEEENVEFEIELGELFHARPIAFITTFKEVVQTWFYTETPKLYSTSGRLNTPPPEKQS